MRNPRQIPAFAPSQDVRFGSKADMCGAKRYVRFTPNSDRKSGLRQTVMSALPPKADIRPLGLLQQCHLDECERTNALKAPSFKAEYK
jgi:hypothetical protein